jgi:hypothetical protein
LRGHVYAILGAETSSQNDYVQASALAGESPFVPENCASPNPGTQEQ